MTKELTDTMVQQSPVKGSVMRMKTKPVGARVYCPRCGTSCDVQVSETVQSWGADGAVACRDMECGYSATVGVLYGINFQRWQTSNQFERLPVTLAQGETRDHLPIVCPQCQKNAGIRSSLRESAFLKSLYFYCESCEFRGKAYVQHLKLLQTTSADIMRVIPLHPRLRQACLNELGFDLERWRKYQYDGTRTRNARLAGTARAGHWNC